MTTNVRFFFTW